MARPLTRWRGMLALLAALAAIPATPRACSMSSMHTFEWTFHPGPDAGPGFVRGRLGILRPSFRARYLVVAWRYLSGLPLTRSERDSAQSAFDGLSRGSVDSWSLDHHASRRWLEARRGVPRTRDRNIIQAYAAAQDADGVRLSYRCITNDAFETAIQTLRSRVDRFGVESPRVREWLAAQDWVFDQCAVVTDPPPPLSAGAPGDERADREYQLASGLLYSRRFEQAERRFRSIGLDERSSWRRYGRYLAGRALLRRGLLVAREDSCDRETMGRAIATLDSVGRERSAGSLASSALRLADYARCRLEPGASFERIGRRLATPGAVTTFGSDLDQYAKLLARDTLRSSDPLTEWILAYRRRDLPRILERWRATHSRAWLIAALECRPYGEPAFDSLLSEALGVKPGEPAYETARHHAIVSALLRPRRVEESGAQDLARARARLAEVPAAALDSMPLSTRNTFLGLGAWIAPDLAEFLKRSVRHFAGEDVDGVYEVPLHSERFSACDDRSHWGISSDVRAVLNQALPLRTLVEAARARSLPAELRRELTRAVLARAWLLDSVATAVRLAADLDSLVTEDRYLLEIRRARTREARDWAFTRWVTFDPQLRPIVPEEYQGDRWCTPLGQPGVSWAERTPPAGDPGRPAWEAMALAWSLPAWLRAGDFAQARAERERIERLGHGVDWVSARVLAYARAHPGDTQVPETLERAIYAGKGVCRSDAGRELGRQMFRLLKSRYASSEAATRTKYWY